MSIDIGSSGIKLVELDISGRKPRLLNIAMAPVNADVFSNNIITKTDKVAEQITNILDANSIIPKRVSIAMPGPSVFTKRISVQKMDFSQISSFIEMEAGSFIPHNIEAVRLDYHVIGEIDEDQMAILVVAVKNEVIDSYMEALSLCGLEAAVVDVDYFALQNMFEQNYPEHLDKTVALVNIGSRYTSINICRAGDSLCTGDMALGGKATTDALVEELGLTVEDAEKLKRKADPANPELEKAIQIINHNVDHMASEYARQLSLLWSASGEEGVIDMIQVAGGAALMPNLISEIAAKTTIPCERIDPFKEIECGDTFDAGYLKDVSAYVGIGVGLALRETGDKIYPEFE